MTLTRFASTDLFQPRTLTEQHLFLEEIVETFDARLVAGESETRGRPTRAPADPLDSPAASPAHEQPELFAA